MHLLFFYDRIKWTDRKMQRGQNKTPNNDMCSEIIGNCRYTDDIHTKIDHAAKGSTMGGHMDKRTKEETLGILMSITENMREGVHLIDNDGVTLIYNNAMAKIEDTRREEVIGKTFREAFPGFGPQESTLEKALMGEKIPEFQQTYTNKFGKEITTVNSTMPVYSGGKIIGAIEVSNDITTIKTMTDRIMNLQEERYKPENREFPRIRHYNFIDIIGNNADFLDTVKRAKKAAYSKAPVFIYGETGTGKELFAQSIHYAGPRKNKPFIAQNCAALPESLLEGILFGTVKGGFTGAEDRAGLFEQASGGTLLLDEISAMPYNLQSKLLRVLQEDYVRRVGGSKDIPVDVRIIANVNRPPDELMDSGALREDLYYRLSIVNLNIPPLRERKDDIELLAERLLDKQCRRTGKRIPGFSKKAMEQLHAHDYPGNVRELENIIMSAVAMGDNGREIEELQMTPDRRDRGGSGKGADGFVAGRDRLDTYMEETEKVLIRRIMAEEGGNISRAAGVLGIKRQTLQHKLKKYGIR